MSRRIEQVVEDTRPLPEDAVGTCLFIGGPGEGGENEPLPVDMLRALFYAVERTRRELEEGKKARVEVISHMPRALGESDGDVRKVLEKLEASGNGGSNDRALLEIERTRARIIESLARVFELDEDVEVVGFTDKLIGNPERGIMQDIDALRDFSNSVTSAKSQLANTLNIDWGKGRAISPVVLKQALIDLIPYWIKTIVDTETGKAKLLPSEQIDKLIYYPLVELCRIIKKMSARAGIFLPALEGRYVPVAKAYMQLTLATQAGGSKRDDYVRLTQTVEGLKLPRLPGTGRQKNPRLSRGDSYRVHPPTEQEKARRLLMYPVDISSDGRSKTALLEDKLLKRSDIPQAIKTSYIRQIIVTTLRLLHALSKRSQRTRARLEKALGKDVHIVKATLDHVPADTIWLSPGLIEGYADTLVKLFVDEVMEPASDAIQDALAAA